MPKSPFPLLRNLAAILMILSGSTLVAALWLRELTGAAVIDALLGAVYLIIGIGLFGQSRFTLFMAMVVPAATAWYLSRTLPQADPVYNARFAIDALVVLFSALVLWQVRNEPGD